ncbi:ATP-binding protein [Streptacidiphilus monticola]
MPAGHPVSRETATRSAELFGRDADLTLLRQRLHDSRLVTLTGPGGMGKTTLARETAAQHQGGAAFADLSMITDGGQLPQAVLGALGLRDSGVLGGAAPTLARLTAALAERGAFLLVLDNCEQVVADAAALVEELLAACHDLRILATSREALLVPGEFLLPLEPLAEEAAVRLFAERGRAVRPDFDLTTHAAEVAEICRRLDGLPLAVELAAARLRILTPRQIADRLDDRFRLLTASRSRGAQPRQQTLRAVVEWSWDLLDEDERRMLTRVAVFTGGWTLEAAEAVCGAGAQTLDLIGALVDKSLVVAGPGRYRMLETIRAFAAEKLAASGDEPGLRSAHRDYFLSLAQTWEPQLRTARQLGVLERFDDEHDNMLAALRDAPAAGALDMVACMSTYWMLRGLRGQGRGPARRILRALGPDIPPGCEEQYVLCVLAAISAGIDSAELQECVDRCRPLMDRLMFTHPLRYPSLLLLWAPFTGVPDEEDMIARNQAALRVVDDPWYLALMHFGVGFQFWYQAADPEATGREFGLALTGFEELGDRWGMMMALMELARLAGRTGNRKLASERTDRALEIAEQLRSPDDMAEMLWSRAEFALHDDDLDAAEVDLLRAEELARSLGISDNLARTRWLLAELALRRGELDEAERLCEAARSALVIGWSSAEWTGAAICAVTARVALARGDSGRAVDALRAAARTAPARNAPARGPAWEVLRELALAEGRPELAARVVASGPEGMEELLAEW